MCSSINIIGTKLGVCTQTTQLSVVKLVDPPTGFRPEAAEAQFEEIPSCQIVCRSLLKETLAQNRSDESIWEGDAELLDR